MVSIKYILHINIFFILFSLLNAKDISTFSNFEQIRQTNLEINFNIDFKQKLVNGLVKIYFQALKDGEVIVLDTKALKINSVIDSDTGEDLEYILDTQYELESLGVPLKIYREYNKDDFITLLISFTTTEQGTSIQWLTPEQTSGKKYPYMFTQGESIINRELFPTQDTPSVKTPVTVGITVEKPLYAVESGLYQKKIDNGDTTTFFYYQKVPIPSYLIAIAAGAIEQRVITDRIKVYGEKEIVDKAAGEFEDIENLIQAAESYLFPYEWGEYNILVMPPSFPYGAMENPTLTFSMPSIISGDKSLVSLLSHEISHSWCGNLVTNKDWSNFWLNEGFDVFMETKIQEILGGKELAKLHGLTYKYLLSDTINSVGASRSFSSLHPYLVGRHPDDAFNVIPYLKGFIFLYYLEGLVNIKENNDIFRKILRNYFTKFKYQSITYEDFKELFIAKVKEELPEEAEGILSQIEWEKWIEAPGYPPIDVDFSNEYDKTVKEKIELFYQNKLEEDFVEIFKNWHMDVKQSFLSTIYISDKILDEVQYNYLTNVLDLKEGYNSHLRYEYYLIILTKSNILEDKIKQDLIEYLGTIGRINYLRDLYPAFYKKDKDAALETFEKYKNFYHPMVVKYVEIELKNLS